MLHTRTVLFINKIEIIDAHHRRCVAAAAMAAAVVATATVPVNNLFSVNLSTIFTESPLKLATYSIDTPYAGLSNTNHLWLPRFDLLAYQKRAHISSHFLIDVFVLVDLWYSPLCCYTASLRTHVFFS